MSDDTHTLMLRESSGRVAGEHPPRSTTVQQQMRDEFQLGVERSREAWLLSRALHGSSLAGSRVRNNNNTNQSVTTKHPGVRCDLCCQMIDAGCRYKCLDCHDFDMCEQCARSGGLESHRGTSNTGIDREQHVFAAIVDSNRVNVEYYKRQQ